MCGIVGFLAAGAGARAGLGEWVSAMSDTLVHRGPDAGGGWADTQAGIALGHRRLSIIDVSSAGAQPMISGDERWVGIYNGELYNTEELRTDLVAVRQGINWRGHSDTEVVLEAVAHWGVRAAIERCNGIFAWALWDRRDRRLWLVRDRLGVKPLYWARLSNGTILFGSELRALRNYPGASFQINPDALAVYLSSGYIGAPLTIYQNVHKLPPGHLLQVTADGEPDVVCFWDHHAVAVEGQHNLDQRLEAEVTEDLDRLLRDAVGRQMVSDVPLGAFLSGGIDSSLVVALMQAQASKPVRTFAIGFREDRFNEADEARRVAAHLKTDHAELVVEPDAARSVIARLPEIYDEPFGDSSQIPTFLVSQLARQRVTVALSGDGGDECFAGYTRYHWIDRLARWNSLFPSSLVRGFCSALTLASPSMWDSMLRILPNRLQPALAGDKIHKAAAVLSAGDADDMYRSLITQWSMPQALVRGTTASARADAKRPLDFHSADNISRFRYFDLMHYLPDDILTKVDRASMAVSLEVRVPLLDHRLVEYSWRLPRRHLSKGPAGKRILRRVLARYVPPHLFERPKHGFAVPIGRWMRGPLREWTNDLLSDRALQASGLLNPEPIRQRLGEHLAGTRNWQHPLWTVLMFQAWHRRWHA